MGDKTSQGWSGLETKLGPLEIRTPLIAASGTFGYGTEFDNLADFSAFGALTLKAVSLEPRSGNPYPRIVETPSGMLNCIGLENKGIEAFVGEILPASAKLGVPLIANLVGDKIEDYVELTKILNREKNIAALEINASCPNVEHGYKSFGTDPTVLLKLIIAVRERTDKPVIVKLSPNVTDIFPLAEAGRVGGADILNLGNTVLGMSICVETRRSRLSRDHAGLSGRAIRPIGVRIVHQVASEIETPIIGTGGVYTTNDTLEYLIAGATAVSLGTVNFIHPDRANQICRGLTEYLLHYGMSLRELTGSYRGPA